MTDLQSALQYKISNNVEQDVCVTKILRTFE